MKKKHIGSTLNEFLEEEDLLIESELAAIKRLLAAQVKKAMKDREMSKTKMAKKMGTSRMALERLLDSTNTSVILHTLDRAAHAVGKKLHIAIA